jgi:hypothetical protein
MLLNVKNSKDKLIKGLRYYATHEMRWCGDMDIMNEYCSNKLTFSSSQYNDWFLTNNTFIYHGSNVPNVFLKWKVYGWWTKHYYKRCIWTKSKIEGYSLSKYEIKQDSEKEYLQIYPQLKWIYDIYHKIYKEEI